MSSDPQGYNPALFQPGSYIAENLCVQSFLGSGGMSDVYKCRDEGLARIVAVKTLKAGFTDQALRRLQIEGRAIAGLEHQNIVQLYGLRFGSNSLPILVMEFVDGISLSALLEKEGALPLPRSLRIAAQIAEGLQAAQRHRVIHRDLKPSNIMIVNAGALDERVKILDFGIAKIQSEVSVKATQTGAVLGTPQYMSPEQAQGKKCDGSTDQYSLGCVLFEMLCGHPPFQYDSLVEILIAHTKEQAPGLSKVMKTPPPVAVQHIVAKLLQKHPDDRYESMYDVTQAIFAASTRNKLPVGRTIGLVLGFVAIAGATVLFNLRGLERKNSAPLNNAANIREAETVPLPLPASTSAAPPAHVPPTEFTENERGILDNPGLYIHDGHLDAPENPNLSDAGLAKLIQGRKIQFVSLRKCPNITSESVRVLSRLPALIELDLGFTRVDDDAADYLAKMRHLKILCLKDLNVTTKTCEKLADLPNLSQLFLAGTQITGESLVPISHITSLQLLDLAYTKIRGSIHNLKDSNVQDLILIADDLSQEDFEQGLQKMKRLRALRFDGTEITRSQFLSLWRLKDLSHVSVNDCSLLTHEDFIQFHKLLPQCLITQNLSPDQTEIMPTIKTSLLTGPELISNGDFESGKGAAPDQLITNKDNSLPGWNVWAEDVHWINRKLVTPATGSNSIHLTGSMQQKFLTTPGAKYCVRCKVALCPDPDPNENRRPQNFEVKVGTDNLTYTLPFAKNSGRQMGWREYVWTFRATQRESNLIIEKPGGANPLGPFIDSISVRKVIEK